MISNVNLRGGGETWMESATLLMEFKFYFQKPTPHPVLQTMDLYREIHGFSQVPKRWGVESLWPLSHKAKKEIKKLREYFLESYIIPI